MQNIRKTFRFIDMKKIKKYVVFKYEDEFGFHYMVMVKLPGERERPTYMEPISSEKMVGPIGFYYVMREGPPREEPTHPETLSFKGKINPNCTPGAITRQQFSEDGKLAYVPSSKFVTVVGWWPDNEDIPEWRERTRAYRATKAPERKGGEIPSSRKSLSLHEKQTIASAQAECGGGDLLL